MSLQSIFHAIQELGPMTFIRESGLTYPMIMSTHLAGIAVFGGMVFATNMRLLGLAFTEYTITDVIKGLRPFKHAGLTIVVVCGLLLGTSEADKYYPNPYFWVKMTMLFLAIVHAFYFRSSVYKNTEELDKLPAPTGAMKAAAITSMLIWMTIPCMGRLIAYYE